MAVMTVRLFGRFEVLCQGQPSRALNARRAGELLSYLILHQNQFQQRETLAGLLWEDAPPAQARKYLRQALWQIHTALHRNGEDEGTNPVEVDPEWIRLKACDRLTVDVTRFQHATGACHGIRGPHLDDAARQQLEDAVGLYRGDLLEGWFQDWCLFERESLQNEFLDALEKLVCWCEARGDSERGLKHARRMLAIDPAREQVHRHIMQLHLLAGNRTEALRAFQCCEKVLMDEFGVRPSHQTASLCESIREEREDPQSLPWAATAPLVQNQLPAVTDLLHRVQLLLEGIETRLQTGAASSAELE